MSADEIRSKYLSFFQKAPRNHKLIPSAPLVPENDPTTLFVSSGMQPLIPYLLGQPHPLGKRLVNSQKSFRSQDIDEVGDTGHTTFFEMLGNWSLGDYFKKEQLPWFYTFLTQELGLDPKRLYVSIFEGNESVPKDEESCNIWKSLGFSESHIYYYGADKNWWSRSGTPKQMTAGEPGGPDTEVFYEFSNKSHSDCHPNCQCGRFMEIGNSVFMEYQKTEEGKIVPLPQKNVDFGGGLERLNAAVNGTPDIFKTDSFSSIISIIEHVTKKSYGKNSAETTSMRIVADHLRGAVMMMADGVVSSKKQQGYMLRRLIRRSMLHIRKLGLWGEWSYIPTLVAAVINLYEDAYPEIVPKQDIIEKLFIAEASRFGKTIEKGLKEIEKISILDGKQAFSLYETYGFPWEVTEEIARDKGHVIDRVQFEEEFKKHQELSRTAGAGMFKGGLADNSEGTTQLHTATHLLHAALRKVLGDQVSQKGSNITVERLRFDFSHPAKITSDELTKIEELVNTAIAKNYPVSYTEIDKQEALSSGALGFFTEKYGDKVKVFTIGSSREICGGPHVSFTAELGHFTIDKEESAGAGIRRIYAHLTHEFTGTIRKPIPSETDA